MSSRIATNIALRRIPASSSRVALRSHGARFNSTTAAPKSADSSHAVAGLAGGALVLGGIYGYYHYSGTAAVINTARQGVAQAKNAKDKLVGATPSPKAALDLARTFSKSYAAAIPGAGPILDQTFDKVDGLLEEYGDEASEILKKTYDDLLKAVNDGKDGGEKFLNVAKEAAEKVQALVEKKGGDAWNKLVEKNPDLAKTLGGGGDELKKLADKHGPEAQKIATSTYSDAAAIVASGGLNAATYEKVKDLITKKTKEISDLSQKAGNDAWEAGSKQFGPLMDKLPKDAKKKAEEYLESAKGIVGEDRVKSLKEVYDELEKVSKSGKSTEEMAKDAQAILEKRIGGLGDLKKKAEGAKSAGGDALSKYADSIPGLGGVLSMFQGKDLEQIKKLAEKHGDEAEKLLHSTYEEIKEVLSKKMEEAKKVGEKTKDDVKKEAKK